MTRTTEAHGKFAIFKNGDKISEWCKGYMAALLTGVDRGYFEIVGGAKWCPETKTLSAYNPLFPEVTYTIPSAPICYEILELRKT